MRGRPLMSCDEINSKTFQRKKAATVKKEQLKRCAKRENNVKVPCTIVNMRCVSKSTKPSSAKVSNKPSSPSPKGLTCNSVKVSQDKNMTYADKKKDLKKQCDKMAQKINKPCKLAGNKLLCRDASRAAQNKKLLMK